MEKSKNGSSILPVTTFAHLIAVAVASLVLAWLLHFREGLAFNSHTKPKIFNIHPLLMIIGFVLIGGEAIMAYKTVPARKSVQKKVHLTLQFVAFVGGIIGVSAVIKFHSEMSLPHFYTLHSWVGIITICFYALQWVCSFLTFAIPHSRTSIREAMAPWHVFAGVIVFLMGVCTSLMGLAEKFTFLHIQRTHEALVINFTGLLVILFAVAVVFTLVFPRFGHGIK